MSTPEQRCVCGHRGSDHKATDPAGPFPCLVCAVCAGFSAVDRSAKSADTAALEQALVDAGNLSTVTSALGIVIGAVAKLPKSRESAIALTHLETALLWLQKQQGDSGKASK